MRLRVHVSSKRTRRTHYVLSDSQVTDDSTQVNITGDDLVHYLEVKQEYERWQEKLKNARRCGWV
jgi:hypothetical protein